MTVTERIPADPRLREAFEEAQAKEAARKRDQAAAKARADAETETKAAIAKEDERKKAAADKARAKEREQVEKARKERREKYLATPLNEKERAELEGLEAAANAPGNPDPDAMRTLADLRIRAKITTKPPKEK